MTGDEVLAVRDIWDWFGERQVFLFQQLAGSELLAIQRPALTYLPPCILDLFRRAPITVRQPAQRGPEAVRVTTTLQIGSVQGTAIETVQGAAAAHPRLRGDHQPRARPWEI